MSLLFDEKTNEPYIQLPAPHTSIRITPPRLSDAPANTLILQHPSVYLNLIGPPFPYEEKHAVEFITSTLVWVEPELERMKVAREANGGKELPVDYIARVCPMKSIREVRDDGTEVFIGDVTLDRSGFDDLVVVPDDPERKARTEENEAKDAGDETIEWTFGGES